MQCGRHLRLGPGGPPVRAALWDPCCVSWSCRWTTCAGARVLQDKAHRDPPPPKNQSQNSSSFRKTGRILSQTHPVSLSLNSVQDRKARPGSLPLSHACRHPPLHVLELLSDGCDLLHAVLVRCQVALEGLVLPQQGPHLGQRRRLIVFLQQDLFFACKVCHKSENALMPHGSFSVTAKFSVTVNAEKRGQRAGQNIGSSIAPGFGRHSAADESPRLPIQEKPVGSILITNLLVHGPGDKDVILQCAPQFH